MELTDWILFGPARLIGLWPYAGVVIAAVLISLQAVLSLRLGKSFGRRFFREAAVFAGLLWLIFNAFELQMAAIAAQPGNAVTLRLDLIVLVPILYALSAAAVWSLFKQMRKGNEPGPEGDSVETNEEQ